MSKTKKKYINYKHNKYLYTDDNWKSVLITEGSTLPNGYEKENNLNLTFEAKLKFELGIKPAMLFIDELKRIQRVREKLLGNPPNLNSGYGDEFEVFALCVLHNISIDRAIKNHIVNGSSDAGIDAIFYDESKCVVYQIKIGQVPSDAIGRMDGVIQAYHNNVLNEVPKSGHLAAFLNKMPIRIDDYHEIIYKTISYDPESDSNYNSNELILKFITKSTTNNAASYQLCLRLKDPLGKKNKYVFSSDKKIFFMFAEAENLIDDIVNCFGADNFESMFGNNVRGDLGNNPEMRDTINNNPEKFCSFNNGVSITGSFSAGQNSFKVYIDDPCIVNGQQTIFNLCRAKKEGVDISNVKVPLFVKYCDNPTDQAQIARFNNVQKSISAIDLLSIDSNLRKIQKELITNDIKDAYYLDLVSSGTKGYVRIAKSIFGKEKIVKVSDFIKLFSVIVDPQSMGQWKNSYNSQIKVAYSNGFPNVDYLVGKKICQCISKSKSIISQDRAKYAIADLSIQYLLYLGVSEDSIMSIIDETTAAYPDMKPADVYKTKRAYDRLKKHAPSGLLL